MLLFDTHCHLDDEQFDDIRRDVVQRAVEAGIERILTVGTTLRSSRKCVAIAEQFPEVVAAVGIQPNYCADAAEDDWPRIVELAQHPRVVALGETGLDRHWDYAPFALQQEYFARHLRLSRETGLPFVVHMRDCESDVVEMLSDAASDAPLHGVMHSFTGSLEGARQCLQLGMFISFAGMVTYKKSEALRGIARQIPADRILVETDAPYLSPHPKRGKRPNEPALIRWTAECLAETRGEPLEQFARRATENAHRLLQRGPAAPARFRSHEP